MQYRPPLGPKQLLEEEQGQPLPEENDVLEALGAGPASLALREARAGVLLAQPGAAHRRSDETHFIGFPSADMRTHEAS